MNLWVIPKENAPIPRVPPTATDGLKAFGAGVHTYEVKSFRSLINFYHKTCCFLPTSIWIDAINKGYFVGWPGLTADRVRKFCKPKEETPKGHMQQLPSNIRSTQKDLMPLPQQKPKSNIRRIGTIAFDETQMKNMIAGKAVDELEALLKQEQEAAARNDYAAAAKAKRAIGELMGRV